MIMFFELIDNILNSMDYVLNTSKKRHIVGGVLLSASALLGGLALTIMTIRSEEKNEEYV